MIIRECNEQILIVCTIVWLVPSPLVLKHTFSLITTWYSSCTYSDIEHWQMNSVQGQMCELDINLFAAFPNDDCLIVYMAMSIVLLSLNLNTVVIVCLLLLFAFCYCCYCLLVVVVSLLLLFACCCFLVVVVCLLFSCCCCLMLYTSVCIYVCVYLCLCVFCLCVGWL